MAIGLNVSGTRVYMAPEYFRFGWYDGCQATVWALGMILVDMLSPYMAFSKPEQAYSRPPRVPHHLSSGNIKKYSDTLEEQNSRANNDPISCPRPISFINNRTIPQG